MTTPLEDYLKSHTDLSPPTSGGDGSRRFDLILPTLPEGRSFKAWLELPKTFPERSLAKIRFSPEFILKIPHVESDGKLCIDAGDPGPLSGANPTERIDQLLNSFFEKFLDPWCKGLLDNDFSLEALNYWTIHCNRNLSDRSALFKIYTVDARINDTVVYEGLYIPSKRIALSAQNNYAMVSRYVSAIAPNAQIRKMLIADIPISHPLTPHSWPTDLKSIYRILNSRLDRTTAEKFIRTSFHRKTAIHKVVLLRAPGCNFGFLLPGGPNAIVRKDKSIHSYPSTRMLPIQVERLDPAWTCGREQHNEIPLRQHTHILVVGAGALGSPVIEQLAKAGAGQITIVDNDLLSSANINRHILGADAIGSAKAVTLAHQLSIRYPSCKFAGVRLTASNWFQKNTLKNIDLVLDLTGEPDVRLDVENARTQNKCALVIGWFEPYVAAAHACVLPAGIGWLNGQPDRLESLQAIEWPDDVMQKEPSCSSTFQSYTPAAATYGVALVTEAALDILDQKIVVPAMRHWIRGQKFLDQNRPGLQLREWAASAASFDGITLEHPL